MALEMGENVSGLQHFLDQSPWRLEPEVIIVEALSKKDGGALIDKFGNIKQNRDSVGVTPQYCRSVG